MEEHEILAVPTGTLGPTLEDVKTGRWRSAVSAKHSAVLAGLGLIGRNTLLITPEYGNMVWLGVVLTEAILEADPVRTGDPCRGCGLCVENCPARALGDLAMNQGACYAHAFGDTYGSANWIFKCYKCREICPHSQGKKNRII
jgi:epoxyqueuosine reductase QueG